MLLPYQTIDSERLRGVVAAGIGSGADNQDFNSDYVDYHLSDVGKFFNF